jgi:hypothetical protein
MLGALGVVLTFCVVSAWNQIAFVERIGTDSAVHHLPQAAEWLLVVASQAGHVAFWLVCSALVVGAGRMASAVRAPGWSAVLHAGALAHGPLLVWALAWALLPAGTGQATPAVLARVDQTKALALVAGLVVLIWRLRLHTPGRSVARTVLIILPLLTMVVLYWAVSRVLGGSG